MPTLRDLVKKSKRLFPNSKSMRKQWVRRTLELETSGQHLARLGKWPYSGMQGRISMRGGTSTEMAALVATTTTMVTLLGPLLADKFNQFYVHLAASLGG
jgi:hypothetical protein